jgi:adenine-specific DNA-methyltransferase
LELDFEALEALAGEEPSPDSHAKERLFICKRGKEQKAAASLETFAEDELQTQAVWDETPNEIRYRVRDPEEFEKGSFRRKDLEGIEGVAIIIGRLKKESVEEGSDPKTMVLQAYWETRADRSRGGRVEFHPQRQ